MKLKEFISVVSEHLGVEAKTVKQIVRILREADLFTTGARGVNAPDITSLDAVRVVIAAVASTSPSRAEVDVRYFGALKPDCREVWTDNTLVLGIGPEKPLEQTLIDCAENRLPYANVGGAVLRLSDNGNAAIHGDNYYQDYHHREQWQLVKNYSHCTGDDTEFKTGDDTEFTRILDSWEAAQRIANAKINRSAELPLETLHSIGFEVVGWEVD